MATITEMLPAAPTISSLRPFDPRRDLQPVADLVELCFLDTLDPDGRAYLTRMRAAASNPRVLSWASTAEWSHPAMGGYVWQQDGRIVGNVSLIPYFIRSQRYFLIANVAVHPDYRRQGIARRLTEEAITHARLRNTPSTWLHVREDNQAAVDLYLSLGFVERARRTTWYNTPEYSQPELPAGLRFTSAPRTAWPELRSWLAQDYPAELSWHMPFKMNLLRPGLVGEFNRFLYNATINQWALVSSSRLLGAIAWQTSSGYANPLWLAAPPFSDERLVHALLVHARQHVPSTRPLMLDYPARQYAGAISKAGFAAHQTLIWMELKLGKGKS
jgi:ribosomal protein S18 acetylase RimI-like enzyme